MAVLAPRLVAVPLSVPWASVHPIIGPDGFVLPSPSLVSCYRCEVVLPVQYLKIVNNVVRVHDRIVQYTLLVLYIIGCNIERV